MASIDTAQENVFATRFRYLIQDKVIEACEYFEVDFTYYEHISAYNLSISCLIGGSKRVSSATVSYDIHLSYTKTAFMLKLKAVLRDLWKSLEEDLGEYPAARLWMWNVLSLPGVCKGEKIPGWAWQRFHAAYPGKVAVMFPSKDPDLLGVRPDVKKVTRDMTKGYEEEMTAGTKRTVRVRKPKMARQIKKPFCPIHTSTEMAFNSVRQVWECQVDNCNLIARPKAEITEGQLLLGKGRASLRLVFNRPGEVPQLLLLSDDNLAINITELVDISTLRVQNVLDAMKEAAASGNTMATIDGLDIHMQLANTPLTIIGIDNAPG